jgi:hypothetical protein
MGLLQDQWGLLKAYVEANTPRNTRPPVSPATVIDNGLLGGRIAQVPQRAQEAYTGLLNAPKQLAALGGKDMNAKVKQAMANPQAANPQQWMDAGMELSGMAPLGGLVGATVYHGSPHKFDKFDMSKIGTGEGAQAYGHGLYMAESPAVANEYAAKLGKPELVFGGKPITQLNVSQEAKDAAKWIESRAGAMSYGAQGRTARDDFSRLPEKIRQELGNVDLFDGGNLYKVDIPDEAIPRMLDWDKPLSEQHPDVQAALGEMGILGNPADVIVKRNEIFANFDAGKITREQRDVMLENLGAKFSQDALGQSVYMNLGNQSKATELLKSKGVPGIKYLDGFSRGPQGGSGTNNYVLFDDQMPRILEKNGQPTGLLSYADEAKKAKK